MIWLVRIVLLLLGVLLLLLLGAFLSGRDKRAYPVMDPSVSVMMSGESMSVQQLAEKYQPLVYLDPAVKNPPLLWQWYNAVDVQDHIDLVYYTVWQNEINPNALIHAYYSLFRAAYYGYPLYDIEYFQVSVSKADGSIQRLMFETGPSDNFYSVFNTHIVAQVERQADGSYEERLSDRDSGEELRSFPIAPEFSGQHAKFAVQTWNHLSKLVTADNAGQYAKQVAVSDLRNLSASDYSNYKFVRKSQGTHVTRESGRSILMAVPAGLLLVTYPFWLLSKVQGISRRRSNAAPNTHQS